MRKTLWDAGAGAQTAETDWLSGVRRMARGRVAYPLHLLRATGVRRETVN